MKIRHLISVVIAVMLLFCTFVMAAEKVSLESVRAPSKGPENAPVTVIEIADYM